MCVCVSFFVTTTRTRTPNRRHHDRTTTPPPPPPLPGLTAAFHQYHLFIFRGEGIRIWNKKRRICQEREEDWVSGFAVGGVWNYVISSRLVRVVIRYRCAHFFTFLLEFYHEIDLPPELYSAEILTTTTKEICWLR